MKILSNSAVSVVAPANATTREEFAAEELTKYLSKVLPGIIVNNCTDDEQVNANKILIGGPKRNKMTAQYISEKNFDSAVPGPEGMMIKALRICDRRVELWSYLTE